MPGAMGVDGGTSVPSIFVPPVSAAEPGTATVRLSPGSSLRASFITPAVTPSTATAAMNVTPRREK